MGAGAGIFPTSLIANRGRRESLSPFRAVRLFADEGVEAGAATGAAGLDLPQAEGKGWRPMADTKEPSGSADPEGLRMEA